MSKPSPRWLAIFYLLVAGLAAASAIYILTLGARIDMPWQFLVILTVHVLIGVWCVQRSGMIWNRQQ